MDFKPLQRNLGKIHMTEKHKLQWKANNWLAENFPPKNDLAEMASNVVMWQWSVDTLFWQLLIDHNVDVYYQVKHRLQAPTLAWTFGISHRFPCGTDRQTDI